MTTTPANPAKDTPTGEPHHTAGAFTLTPTQKRLIAIVALGALLMAGIGFAGSYNAVTELAEYKGFGWFAKVFTIGVDAGILVLIALDLLLTWLRMPYPLLRQIAWLLTAATIVFNAAASWPDPIGSAMHAVIPVLFIAIVEAARHAIGRVADITADKHIEGPPLSRWLLNPPGTFVLWRRQRMWSIRAWDTVVDLERERRIYRAQLRRKHGRAWRRKATADQLLVLQLTADGMSVQEAIDRPHAEEQKQAEAEAKREAEARAKTEAETEAKHQAELRQAETEAKRRAEIAEAEAAEARARAEAEAAAEAARLEVEAKRRAEAEADRIRQAETEAKLAAIALQQRQAEEEAEAQRRHRLAEQARQEQQARAERERQAQAAREADAHRRRQEQAAAEAKRLREQAAARPETASGSTSGSGTTSVQTRKPASVSASTSKPKPAVSASVSDPANLGGRRSKRQAEIDAVLARIVEAKDPEAVSLEDVMDDFNLKQTTAWDRLSTARAAWASAQQKTA